MERDFLRLNAGYIHRKRLDRLLDKGMRYPLVSVVAGPGFGKTLAVTGYAKTTDMRLIWLRLQESDNDSQAFRQHVAEAAARELPELAGQLKSASVPPGWEGRRIIRQTLETELKNGPPILVVLDCFERVTSSKISRLVCSFINGVADRLHTIAISNETAPLEGFFPSGGQLRISMEDLRFTEEETTELFRAHGMNLAKEIIQEITERTGSWPLILRQICLDQTDGCPDRQRKNTYFQLASELFEQRYFSGYPEETQTLLVSLACVPRFPLELVTMLAPHGTRERVKELSDNVWIQHDFSTGLFHFQPAYRRFLRSRQALLPDGQIEKVHAFMGQWFFAHRNYGEAMGCFWQLPDDERYLEAVFSLPKNRLSVKITSEILRKLETISQKSSRPNPTLAFCKAELLFHGMQVEKALQLLEQLSGYLAEPVNEMPSDLRLLGDVFVALADISMFLNRDDGILYIKKAAELCPNGCRIRTRDSMLVGNNSVFFLPSPAPGQLKRMVDSIFEYAQYADLASNGSGSGYEWLFAAQAAFLSEQFDRAREHSFQAIAKAKLAAQHDIICNAYWELMRIELYTGNYPQAKRWREALTDYIDSRMLTELYELRDCAVSWFRIRMGGCDEAASWAADVASINMDFPLEVGRNRIVLIDTLCALERFHEAYAEITLLEEILRPYGRWCEKNQLLIHKSIRLLARGEKKEAITAFKAAYDMVYQNDIAVLFAEFGKNIQKVIRVAAAQAEIEFDPNWLDMVYKEAGSFEKRASAMRKAHHAQNAADGATDFSLSAKEKEILVHMAQGMTRNEIASLMSTSLSNVKRYLNSIYTKLGALNRADAIHIATRNGILDHTDSD